MVLSPEEAAKGSGAEEGPPGLPRGLSEVAPGGPWAQYLSRGQAWRGSCSQPPGAGSVSPRDPGPGVITGYGVTLGSDRVQGVLRGKDVAPVFSRSPCPPLPPQHCSLPGICALLFP